MTRITSHPRVRRWTRGTVACALTLAAAACAFPTEAPILEQRWNVPAESTEIGVAELLPASVTIQNGLFAVAVPAPAAVTRGLYQDCQACAAADGQTIAKPAFTAVATSTTRLPAELASATLTSGTVRVNVTNQYAFDPMNPAPGTRGSIIVEVLNAGNTLGSVTFDGAAWPLPPGQTRGLDVDITGAVSGADPVIISVRLTSPAGSPAQMSSTQRIVVEGAVVGVRTTAAKVDVTARQINSTSELDLSDVDDELTQRLDSAAIRLSVTNPFAVAGTLTATLETASGMSITRQVQLAANAQNSLQVLRYTASEIKPFFGQVVTLRIAGPVNAAAPVTVTPTQSVSLASRLDLFVSFGR